jgi:hypothetical protein
VARRTGRSLMSCAGLGPYYRVGGRVLAPGRRPDGALAIAASNPVPRPPQPAGRSQ